MPTRLQKFIASTGLTSRRQAEELITAGRVFVNGHKVTKLGTTIDPDTDIVRVNGKDLVKVTTFRYVAVNKPKGVICTRAQYKNERSVYSIIPGLLDLVIAGRLDKDSDGLIILTNDGELTNQLTHPRYKHEKEYEVVTVHPLTAEALAALKRGLKLTEGIAHFDRITEIEPSRYRVVIHQGWKRQIRRMMGEVNNDVAKLTRVRINKLELGTLPVGQSRKIERSDIM